MTTLTNNRHGQKHLTRVSPRFCGQRSPPAARPQPARSLPADRPQEIWRQSVAIGCWNERVPGEKTDAIGCWDEQVPGEKTG